MNNFKVMKFDCKGKPETCRQIIKRLVELGYSVTDHFYTSNFDYLYTYEDGGVTYGSWRETFGGHDNPEFFLGDLYDIPPEMHTVALDGKVMEIPHPVYESLLRKLEVYLDD